MASRLHSTVHGTVAWATLAGSLFVFACVFNTCVTTQNTLASLQQTSHSSAPLMAGARSVRRGNSLAMINSTCAVVNYTTFTTALKTAVDAHAAAVKTALDARQTAYVAALTNNGADRKSFLQKAQAAYQAALQTADQARMKAGADALAALQLSLKGSCSVAPDSTPPTNNADQQQ